MITQSIARDAVPVTAAMMDQPLPNTDCQGLWVGGGGTLSVVMAGSGRVVTFTAVQTGFFGLHISQVNSAGTTCTGLIALYI